MVWSHQLPDPPVAALAPPAVAEFWATNGQVLFARTSLFAPERPLSAPRATTAEKAATSTERSSLLRIIGFVLT
ncbi:hypothetical protein GCM10010508_09660 [Streptomyces naganishii JCM 4654]|uniref:Uncharacterized protein n=1 Tax=Streptomyces naganishii JCM 4654 TaxID=1306179 RepID=A0A918Y0S5_9ACTN|nr:hypothetical protein GCM10010508_09660 [Streptomyces naganishii JCM 4654]